jgi:hypothetical protein
MQFPHSRLKVLRLATGESHRRPTDIAYIPAGAKPKLAGIFL